METVGTLGSPDPQVWLLLGLEPSESESQEGPRDTRPPGQEEKRTEARGLADFLL